jgi:hypothetical protein
VNATAPANVLAFRTLAGDNERLMAYYIALSVEPAIKDAAPEVRAQLVERVIAGWRAAVRGFAPLDALDAKAHGEALALMAYDDDQQRDRISRGGW